MKLGRLVGVGNTASVYEWGDSEVVKLFHPTEWARYDAEKEARNAEIVSKLNIRAPRYSGLIEYEGQHGLIYEKIEGAPMLVAIEPTRDSVRDHARILAQLQYELHQIPIQHEPNLKAEILNRLQGTQELKEDEKQRVKETLSVLPEGEALCHYDLHPGNIILSPEGPVIIDWVNALIGDPAADVARSSMIFLSNDLPPNAPEWLLNSWLGKREYRLFFHEQYWQEYESLSGMNPQRVEEWMLPTLAARLVEVDEPSRKPLLAQIQTRWAL